MGEIEPDGAKGLGDQEESGFYWSGGILMKLSWETVERMWEI